MLLDFDGVDAGLRRRGMTQHVEEGVQRGTLALHLDPHRAGIVADPTAQLAAAGHLIDEGAKSDPLHDAAHGDGQATHGRSGWRWIHGPCNWRRRVDPFILKFTSGGRAG